MRIHKGLSSLLKAPGHLSWRWVLAGMAGLLLMAAIDSHGQAPLYTIDLEKTLSRTLETDKDVLRQQTEWLYDEEKIKEIGADDGWQLEVRGKKEIVHGTRTDSRDDSWGRDPREDQATLEEHMESIQMGLIKEFLDTKRKQQDDMTAERLKQLDRSQTLVDTANKAALAVGMAYLDVYFGREILSMLERQVAFEEENLRALKARQEQYEALQLDVMTTEVGLATLRKRFNDELMKNNRKLDILRMIWTDKDLAPEQLAAPHIDDATRLELSDPQALIEEAWSKRPDLAAIRTALSTVRQNAGNIKKLPELELGVAGRAYQFHRDFGDEDRHVDSFDVLMEMNLRVPLSLSKQNALRKKMHDLDLKSRSQDIEAQMTSIANNVRQAQEDYKSACEDARIMQLTIRQNMEAERIARLTANTMPELMKSNPEFEISKAASKVQESRADLIRAEKLRMEMLLTLLGEMGLLSPGMPLHGMNR